jgi:hypothetical protein
MPFDIEAARKDGVPDSAIAEHLARESKFDIEAARKDGVPDRAIADHLVGKSSAPAQAKPEEEKKPSSEKAIGPKREATWLEQVNPIPMVKNTGIDLAKGAIGVGQAGLGINALTGLDNPSLEQVATNPMLYGPGYLSQHVAKPLIEKVTGSELPTPKEALKNTSDWQDYLSSGYGKATAISKENVQRDLANAEGWDKLPVGIASLASNPRAASSEIVESIPAMLTGSKMAKGLSDSVSLATKLGVGEGFVSMGNTSASILQQSKYDKLNPVQKAAAVISGILTGALGGFGQKVSKYIGATDVDELLMAGANRNFTPELGSKLVNAFKTGLVESTVEELPQGAQDQVAQNLALGKPWDEGVAEAMAHGLVAAFPMGAGFGAYEQHKANQFITGTKDQEAYLAEQEATAKEQAKVNAKFDTQGMTAEEKARYKLEQAGTPIPKSQAELEADSYGTGTNITNNGTSSSVSGGANNAEPDTGVGTDNGSGVAGAGVDDGTNTGGENALLASLNESERKVADAASQSGASFKAPSHARNWVIKNVLNGDKDAAAKLEKDNPGIYKKVFELSKIEPVTQEQASVEELAPVEPKTLDQEQADDLATLEQAPVEPSSAPLDVKSMHEKILADAAAKVEPIKVEEEAQATAANIELTQAEKLQLQKDKDVAKAKTSLSKLAGAISKPGRMNVMPEEDIDYLGEVTNLFSAAIGAGSVSFQQAVAHVTEQLKEYGLSIDDIKEYLETAYNRATAGLRSQTRMQQEAKLEGEQKAFEAEAPQRTEVLDQKEMERVERAYQVKSTSAADIGEEELAGYEANKGRQAELLGKPVEGEAELKKQDMYSTELPAWDKLNTAEKTVYNAVNKTKGADAAIKALNDFRTDRNGEANESTAPRDPNAALYELNKDTASKEHKIEFPLWQQLSEPAQNLFLQSLPKLSADKPTHSGAGVHSAFEKVATQLEKENVGFRGKHRLDIENAELDSQSQQAQSEYQAEEDKAKAAEKQAVGKGTKLPESAVEALNQDGIGGVLDYIASGAQGLDLKIKKLDEKGRLVVNENGDLVAGKEISPAFKLLRSIHEKASQKVFKALAKTLSRIGFESKVVTDPNDLNIMALQQEGKLAEYDPKTDTFYFTPEGMDEATILHEVLHAATVKLISQYKTNPELLTQNQKDAVEHLEKLYGFVSKRLGNKYANATENIYEFVAYAMTDFKFQNELAKLQVPSLGKYTLQGDLGMLAKSAWFQFTTALSQMYNLIKAGPTGLKLYDEVYTGVAKDFATVKGSLEELYKDVSDDDLAFEEASYEETEPKAPAKFMAAKRLLSIQKGFEGNVLLEVAEVMNRILAAPQEGTDVEPLAAKKATKAPIQAPVPTTPTTMEERFKARSQELVSKSASTTSIALKVIYGTIKNPRHAYREAVRHFESNSQPLKLIQAQLKRAHRLITDKSKQFNDTYSLLMSAAARSNVVYTQKFGIHEEVIKDKLAELKKRSKLSTDQMFADVQLYLTGLHEPERRRWFFMRSVPLRISGPQITIAGITDFPANHRDRLLNALEHLTDTPGGMTAKDKAIKIREHLDNLIFSKVGDINNPTATAAQREGVLNKANVDFGEKANRPQLYDEKHEKNNVIGGYKVQDIDDYRARLDSLPYKDLVFQILKVMKSVQDETIALNLQSNFYTQSNVNYINMTGYNWYIPFKGRPEETKTETEMFRNNDTRYSGDLQFWDPVAKGRESLANNPVAQTLVDAKKAAYILAHQPVTESVVNNIKQGNITGNLEKTISQDEKYKLASKQEAGTSNTIFHHLPNGKIQVWKIDNPMHLAALRRPYKSIQNPVYRWGFNNVANATRLIGQGFTRFYPAFAPANAVKDTIPNLFYITKAYGPIAGAEFLVNVINTATADTVTGGGVFSAGTCMYHMQNKNRTALEAKAKTDNFSKLFLELHDKGGIVSFLQGVSTPREHKILADSIKSGKLDTLTHVATVGFDYWMHMAEMSVRVSVYKTVKEHLMDTGKSETAAIDEAAHFAKEVANFEHAGINGKGLAALYTFARATSTGVVRFFDDLSLTLPMSLDSAIKDLPESISKNPKAKANFIKSFKEEQLRARIVAAAYIGMGYFAYMAALSGSEDDDKGRNIVATDDMSLWTRAMRFTVPGTKYMFQVPTGYGPGSLIALGQQIAGLNQGNQSPKDFISNLATIMQDSFMPFPVSRIPITEHPIASIADTISPSILKPVIEHALLNMNGLGMQITQDQGNKSSAYTSTGNIPEIYKTTAKWMSDHSDHIIDISPNVLYFYASNYINGFSLLAKYISTLSVIADGDKEYDIGTDNPLVSGFVGRKPTPDSREYHRLRTLIQGKQSALDAAGKTSYESIALYKSRHPNDAYLIEKFEADAAALNELNHIRRTIDANKQGYTIKAKQEMLDSNKAQIEAKKYVLNMYYKQIDESLK